MRIAICDDSLECLTSVQEQIRHWSGYSSTTITEIFEDGDALIHAHETMPFDVILLDVVMPLLNGIEAAREIRRMDEAVKIIFLSTSREFAVDSYDVKAYYYLLKPLKPEKLYYCLDQIAAEFRQKS